MVTTDQIFQAIAAVSKQNQELSNRIDEALRLMHDTNAANISYLAMMTSNDLPDEETEETEEA